MCDKASLNNILEKIQMSAKDIFEDKLDSVILYGSYARGDFNSDSDIDIMILVDMSKEELIKYRKAVYKVAHDISYENEIIISPHLQDKETFENWTESVPFYQNVMREGVSLNYEH